MIRLRETVITPRPRHEVFAYVADFTTVAEWDPGIASAARSEGDGGVGTTYDVLATFRGREIPMTYEVTEYVENEKIVLFGSAATLDAVDTIEFFDREGVTEIVYSAEFTLKGFLRFVEPLLRPAFTKLGRKALGGLDATLNG